MDEKTLKAVTEAIVEEVHPDEVILFGSHARGEEPLERQPVLDKVREPADYVGTLVEEQ